VDYQQFDSLFHPSSIAMVGASPDPANSFMLNIMLKHGFGGKIYPVNSAASEVLGLKAYASIKEIPDTVDYAFLQAPAKAIIQVIRDCAAKKVKLVTVFSAGFGESEIEGGGKLEHELADAAREGGVRLLGPNCMGLYCPAAHLAFASEFPRESGPVGVLCQSGGNSMQLVRAAAQRGIRFSKLVSYGNAADINESDLMEYFAKDLETRVIIAYIEGAKEGRRFSDALRATARVKPVILLKGGRNEGGAIAALSHTGSLAGSREVWDGLLKQANALQVYSIDECVDVALALLFMRPPSSRRAVIIGLGGGATVLATDDCYDAGLMLPPLPEQTKQALRKVTREAGKIFKNPVDLSDMFAFPSQIAHSVKVAGSGTGADLLIIHFGLEVGPYVIGLKRVTPVAEAIMDAVREIGKPTALVVHAAYSDDALQAFLKVQRMCAEAGMPFYSAFRRAVSAINKVIDYHQNQ
jgi:acyl-CoA synthetase (NDP forming)